MSDYHYTLRDDAPDWARDLHDAHVEQYPESGGFLVKCDLADAVLDRTSNASTSRYAVRATIAAFRGCFDRWEVVASVDHGLRAADETMVCKCAILADIIMRPVLALMTYGLSHYDYAERLDAWGAACEEIAPYDGGWCEPTDNDPYRERAKRLHKSVVWCRSYDQCSDVMVETSGDAGMTWFAVRVPS